MEVRVVDHAVGRLSGQRLDAEEKRGAVIAARPNAEGLLINKVTGESSLAKA